MVGGTRPPPNPASNLRTDYPYAGSVFDDRAWETVNAPHDFIATNGESAMGMPI